jgi:alpha-L-fucosidase
VAVGRGASLLLNVPPNRQGLLQSEDVASPKDFHHIVQEMFHLNLVGKAALHASNVRGKSQQYGTHNLVNGSPNSYRATDDTSMTPELIVDFHSPETFNLLSVREAIQLGQRIESFALDIWQEDQWKEITTGTSVGSCRLIRLSAPVITQRARLRIIKSPGCIALCEFGLYFDRSRLTKSAA